MDIEITGLGEDRMQTMTPIKETYFFKIKISELKQSNKSGTITYRRSKEKIYPKDQHNVYYSLTTEELHKVEEILFILQAVCCGTENILHPRK
jgi:hypothetical protein